MEFFSINLGTDFSAVVDPNLGKIKDEKEKPVRVLNPKKSIIDKLMGGKKIH